VVEHRIRAAYHADSALVAQAGLEALAAELDKARPRRRGQPARRPRRDSDRAAARVPPTLARSLRSTNCIESMIGICREHAKNVKNWKDGQMIC
jgi:putative transposase